MIALPGCAEDDDGNGGESTTETTTAAGVAACTETPSGTVPGYTIHGGSWRELASYDGHSGVICGNTTTPLASLVKDAGSFTDFEALVSFNMLAGDSGAGLVVHFADEQNYNIVRYSPREQGWHLFTMVAGNRQKQDDASVTPPTTNPEIGQWVQLSVRSQGGHVTAFDGNVKVIDYTLKPEASHTGKVGFFLRDDGMAAVFDDLTANTLG
jgi:hypothetical protein